MNGLIYVHRISDPRMGAISKRNLRMFRQLSGDGALKNVCIATTNWDRVTAEEGNMREQELRENPNLFKPLIDEGAELARHDKDITSARSIINYLIHKDPTKLQIQVELDEGKKLEDTEAGSVLKEEIKAFAKKLEERLLGLKEEMEEAARGKHAELLVELEEERHKGEVQRKKLEDDLKHLKIQAQSDKMEHEAKVRGLEDEMAKKKEVELLADLLGELERNNREGLESMKQQARHDKDEHEAKMRILEDKVAVDVKKECEAREEMERNNRERLELLKQQARRDKDEHEAKIRSLEDEITADMKKREVTLLAEREAREDLERSNRERFELLEHERDLKIRSLEDKMAANVKKWEAELLAERKAREEMEQNNREHLELLKQQVQDDKHEHEANIHGLEDKMVADLSKREADLLAERETREELERNNRERLESLKQQVHNDKLKQEEKARSLEDKMAKAREELERSNREHFELLKQQAQSDKVNHEAKMRNLEDKMAAEVDEREAELLAERTAREELDKSNRERLELLKQQVQSERVKQEEKVRGLHDRIAADVKKGETAVLAEREAREELERSNHERLEILKQQAQSDKGDLEVKLRSLEDKMTLDVKKWKAELLAERKAREELERKSRERLELLNQQAQHNKNQRDAELLTLNKRLVWLEEEAKAREAENRARAEQERKNQWGITFWGILYYPLTLWR